MPQYSSALLQESGVPAPLLLNACAERSSLIDELQQSLMQCRLGAQHLSIVYKGAHAGVMLSSAFCKYVIQKDSQGVQKLALAVSIYTAGALSLMSDLRPASSSHMLRISYLRGWPDYVYTC